MPEKAGRITPARAYAALYGFFGPQGWWPVTVKKGEAPRYRKGCYTGKNAAEKFEICAGALLAQNTAWKNAEKALINLNRSGALCADRISRLPEHRLAELIRPSGYYNQKAARLKVFSSYVLKNYGGNILRLLEKPGAGLRQELLAISGIGPETADSMLLYAAGKKYFVIDAYTLRLGGRLGWFGAGTGYGEAQEFMVSQLPRSLKVYNEFHALIVTHGKDFCKIKPVCGGCPLREKCLHEKGN